MAMKGVAKIEIDGNSWLAPPWLKCLSRGGGAKKAIQRGTTRPDQTQAKQNSKYGSVPIIYDLATHLPFQSGHGLEGGYYATMSTFSSVVNKSGKKFAPKATARRNVPPRPTATSTTTSTILETPIELVPVPSLGPQGVGAASEASEGQITASENTAPQVGVSQTTTTEHTSTPPNITSPGAISTVTVGSPAEPLKHGGKARKDAIGEEWAVNQNNAVQQRAAKRQAKVNQASSSKGKHDEKLLEDTEVDRQENRSQYESPKLTARSHRSTRSGAKRKADDGVSDAVELTPGYTAATFASEAENVSASENTSRKRRNVAPHGPASATTTDVTQDLVAISEDNSTAQISSPAVVDADEVTESTSQRPKRKRTKKTMVEVAADIVDEATGGTSSVDEQSPGKKKKRKKKKLSPEDAEAHEIAPATVKMVDLVKDKGLGKKSKLESRMEEVDWDEVKQKRKQAEEEAEKQRELEREEKRTGKSTMQDDMPTAPTVPKMSIRNGQIVIDEESRVVDRHAELNAEGADQLVVQEVDDVTKRVNQSTIGRQPGVRQKGFWNDEATDLFYKGLRMFGTDFGMISNMFPRLHRRHIKLKFTREERNNLEKVREHLSPGSKEGVDLEEYSQMSNQVYDDHTKVYEEIKADEIRLREEDAAKRAREAEIEQGLAAGEEQTSNVLQSREQGSAEPPGGHEVDVPGKSSAKESRFASVARSIVNAATAPKKPPKKQSALARKRERKKRTGLEGTEEVIGSIEDA